MDENIIDLSILPVVKLSETRRILSHKALNSWGLFYLISLPICLVMTFKVTTTDLTSGPGVSAMIGYSVRLAVPFIYVVVGASAAHHLFPNVVTTWVRKNRKYIGLCFAVAMAWQAVFIYMVSNVHTAYYYDEIYLLRDELEGSVGYIFLAAMLATTFKPGRNQVTQAQWNLIHTGGIYFLWAYPFSVYWWGLYYYENPELLDYVFYWMGFLAFALRIASWGKTRYHQARRVSSADQPSQWLQVIGGLTILLGLIAATGGLYSQKALTSVLTTPSWSSELVLWLPFWPFEPFIPLATIGLGTLIMTTSRR